jgi:hypothetical protein
VDNQKESVLGRKQLADRTKGHCAYILLTSGYSEHSVEFKKIPDDEKLNSFKGLLKGLHILFLGDLLSSANSGPAYQTEIDSLTKRSKVSENAFLNVYKVLAEAPDPYPLLEAAVVRLTHLSHLSLILHMRRTKRSKPRKHTHWKLKLLDCVLKTLSFDSRLALLMRPNAVSNSWRRVWTSSCHRRSLRSTLRMTNVCATTRSGMWRVIRLSRCFAVAWF